MMIHDVGQVNNQRSKWILLVSQSPIDVSFVSVANTICVNEQNQYDEMKQNGTLGQFMLRPECDIDGYYKATKCIPGQM